MAHSHDQTGLRWFPGQTDVPLEEVIQECPNDGDGAKLSNRGPGGADPSADYVGTELKLQTEEKPYAKFDPGGPAGARYFASCHDRSKRENQRFDCAEGYEQGPGSVETERDASGDLIEDGPHITERYEQR
jgi:hypothetical protein